MRMAALGLLFVVVQGCASTPELNRIAGGSADGQPVLAAGLDWPRPVRVGVYPADDDDLEEFHLQVTSALGDGVDRATISRGPRSGGRVDYMLDVRYRFDGDADGVRNFFTCFPGFVIFAPSWAPLRSEYDLDTSVRLIRVRDEAVIASFTRTDRVEVLCTPVGHAVACYLGWGAPLAPPLILAPLITGIVAAAVPWDERGAARLLAREPQGRSIARDIAAQVVYAIDEDLRGSRGDGFDALRDDLLDAPPPRAPARRAAPRPVTKDDDDRAGDEHRERRREERSDARGN